MEVPTWLRFPTAVPASEPVSLLLKPVGVFDGIDGKVHADW